MNETSRHDAWNAGDSYDAYMGRWSRQIAAKFLDWLDMGKKLDWLESRFCLNVNLAAFLASSSLKDLLPRLAKISLMIGQNFKSVMPKTWHYLISLGIRLFPRLF